MDPISGILGLLSLLGINGFAEPEGGIGSLLDKPAMNPGNFRGASYDPSARKRPMYAYGTYGQLTPPYGRTSMPRGPTPDYGLAGGRQPGPPVPMMTVPPEASLPVYRTVDDLLAYIKGEQPPRLRDDYGFGQYMNVPRSFRTGGGFPSMSRIPGI